MNNNVNLPKHQYAFLRGRFCNNLKRKGPKLIPCVIFGAESLPNRALGFHVLREDGALVSQVPLHALCWDREAPERRLSQLTPWDCFGHWLTVIEFAHLAGMEMDSWRGKDEFVGGEYVCTFDFIDNGFSEYPEQHKALHFIKLAEGNFALQPNNRVRVYHKSFTDRPFTLDKLPEIESNRMTWSAERGD